MVAIFQLFVRHLDGKTITLNFTDPTISAQSIKAHLYDITKIPTHHQRLIANGRLLGDQTLISSDDHRLFPTVHLLLRLLGGKGGFGSLLRGAATKAGQKKTNNFDACRDMSGRRLRHVNAEKKLEEWKAEAEDRKLEKIAEDFLKKNAKAAKKSGGSGDAEKYIEKYRKDSAKCMEEVEASVRESIGVYAKNSKRKVAASTGSDSKRLKIWMGKRKMGGSDSNDMDEDSSDDDADEEEENEKSIVLDSGNHSDSSKEVEGSLGSVSGGKGNRELSGGGSLESGSEEEKETVVQGGLESGGSAEGNSAVEPALEIHEEMITQSPSVSCIEKAVDSGTGAVWAEKQDCNEPESGNLEEVSGQPPSASTSGEGGDFESRPIDAEVNVVSSGVHEEIVVASTDTSDLEKPLCFDDFSSAAEMEVLGMERLKSELQSRGLKCGGTLQERAARLFLLKTTPLEMLPKKLLAKK